MVALAILFLVLWWYLAGTLYREGGRVQSLVATTFVVAAGLDLAYLLLKVI